MDMMSIRRRVLLGSRKKEEGLPDAYQRVEYIESAGTQYIDTLYKPNGYCDQIKLYVDYTSLKQIDEPFQVICGMTNNTASANNACFISQYSTNSMVGQIGSGAETINSKDVNGIIINYGERVQCSLYKTIDNYLHMILTDVVEKSYSKKSTTRFIPNSTLTVFCRNNAGTKVAFCTGRIHELIIWDDPSLIFDESTIVRHLIPCYRKNDNEIGMYDTVSKTFFTNQGTGTFLKGADV